MCRGIPIAAHDEASHRRCALGDHPATPAATAEAALSSPGEKAYRRSPLPERDPVRAEDGNPVGGSSPGTRLGMRDDLLATAGRVAGCWRVGRAASGASRTSAPLETDRLVACRRRLLHDSSRGGGGKKAGQVPWIEAVPVASIICSRTAKASRSWCSSPRRTATTSRSSSRWSMPSRLFKVDAADRGEDQIVSSQTVATTPNVIGNNFGSEGSTPSSRGVGQGTAVTSADSDGSSSARSRGSTSTGDCAFASNSGQISTPPSLSWVLRSSAGTTSNGLSVSRS